MWLANALTLSRIPLAVLFWVTYGDPRWSFALVALAAVTDAADGNVARWAMRRRAARAQATTPATTPPTSTVGEWLDPAADKVFVIVVLGAIQVHDPAPWALIALIAARELVIIPLAAVYRVVMPGPMPHAFKAGVVGKAATVAELFAIAALVVHSPLAWAFAIAAATLGLVAIGTYIARSLRTAPA